MGGVWGSWWHCVHSFNRELNDRILFFPPPHAVWGSSLGSGAAHSWGESFRFHEIFLEASSQLYSLKCVSMVILHQVKLTVKINYHALQKKQRVAFEGLHPFVLLFQNITDFLKCQFFWIFKMTEIYFLGKSKTKKTALCVKAVPSFKVVRMGKTTSSPDRKDRKARGEPPTSSPHSRSSPSPEDFISSQMHLQLSLNVNFKGKSMIW